MKQPQNAVGEAERREGRRSVARIAAEIVEATSNINEHSTARIALGRRDVCVHGGEVRKQHQPFSGVADLGGKDRFFAVKENRIVEITNLLEKGRTDHQAAAMQFVDPNRVVA